MTKAIIKKVGVLAAVFALAVTALLVPVTAPASAADSCASQTYTIQNGVNCAHGEGTPTSLVDGQQSVFTVVVNVLLFVIGAICVIMLIWGGIRYTTSAGNSANVTAAKNTIMYAIIGLVIAFLAFAIVNWVLTSIGKAS
jgi:ABC-type Fe3+ transport system permease subunit